MRTTRSTRWALVCALAATLTSCTSSAAPAPGPTSAPDRLAAVCGHTKPGPASAPDGAITVDPGVDADLSAKTEANPPGTTFWLARGVHTLGDGEFGSVEPKDGNTYLGAPGAVLDGRGVNKYAFVFHATDVTIRGLTIRRFAAPPNEGVVNHDSGDGWVIEDNTVEDNDGAALMAGARQVVRGNCLRNNGQYAINAYKDGELTDLVIEGNEITGNNTDDWEARIPGCGCTGGVKFWAVDGADIRGNWVHDNRGAGLWADTNNNDFLIEGNVIEGNDGPAIFYEISYNAVIRDNTLRRNNIVEGREFADGGDNFPSAAIYLSEAGGDPRVPARTDKIDIYDNVLTDNWSGVTLWENADRFCNSAANTSGGCTRLVSDMAKCAPPTITKDPLYDDCRWKTQRVDIHDNQFSVDPRKVGCKTLCARMAVISNYGTFPDWSPYQADVVQQAITFAQDNTWHDNHYTGPWTFMAKDTGQVINPAQWQSAPYSQDENSTFVQAGG
ncbi:right-handed parallel beta-helix repeat-containing protein [Actinophytocola glycyrrhizae]|uniref:Right-handed parallel beta-helix repeat-containing protein n=1 Tax=Actinophytocola glycyrrhizae TaxID=2044873 RepID=A0ABV9SF63_9PSEU